MNVFDNLLTSFWKIRSKWVLVHILSEPSDVVFAVLSYTCYGSGYKGIKCAENENGLWKRRTIRVVLVSACGNWSYVLVQIPNWEIRFKQVELYFWCANVFVHAR